MTKYLLPAILALTLALSGSLAALFKVHKSLGEQKAHTAYATDRAKELESVLSKERQHAVDLERERISLQRRVDALNVEGARVVTEIREVWRDRVVRDDPSLGLDCSGVSTPVDAFRLFCDAEGFTSPACRAAADTTGPVDSMP